MKPNSNQKQLGLYNFLMSMEKKTHSRVKTLGKGTISQLDPETAYTLGKKRAEVELAYMVIEELFKLNICSKYNREIKRRYKMSSAERTQHEKNSTKKRKEINEQLRMVIKNIKVHQDANDHKKLGRPRKKVDFELID